MKTLLAFALSLVWLLNYASASDSMDEHAKNEVQNLLSVLSEKKSASENPARFCDAIVKLGQLKAVEAIPLLIEHIDFFDSRQLSLKTRFYSILNGRVAVEALIRIGKPSVQPVLEASKKEDRRVRLICMAAVLYEVEGREATMLVEAAIAESKDGKVKARLQQLKSFIVTPPLD